MLDWLTDMDEGQLISAVIIYLVCLIVIWKMFLVNLGLDAYVWGIPLKKFWQIALSIVIAPIILVVVKLRGD